MLNKASTEDMKTLASCLNKLVLDGFEEDFKVTDKGLLGLHNEKHYQAADVEVVNFYRFEGASDPADNSILYAIQTSDGVKGTLIDAYGPYAEPAVSAFMKQVESMHKKNSETVLS
jgi:hypothetical protein